MDKKLTIAFLVQTLGWNPFDQGGASIQVAHILDHLRKAGHTVNLVTINKDKCVKVLNGSNQPLDVRMKLTKGRLFKFLESSLRFMQGKLHLPWFQIFDSFRIVDAISQNLRNVDLLHERNSMHGFGVALAHQILKLPYVLSVDADFLFEHDYLGLVHTRLERWIARLTASYNYHSADAITCVSSVMKNYLVAEYKVQEDKIWVIPNGADANFAPDVESSNRTREALGLAGHPVIMFVGGFYPWHGLDLLIDSFRTVVQKMPEVRLVLVGDGETRPMIQEIVRENNISDKVIFTGRVPHKVISNYLYFADILVAPYPRMETPIWHSPMKLFEYMSSGKAIVASRAGQIGEIVEDGQTGLLVEPGDSDETAEAMLRLLSDSSLRERIGRNAKELVNREYTWGKYVERLEAIYQQVLL
ncbi:MAG: glycosyltransferase family 4 protein [Anaerolineales bacterium]